MNLLSKNLQTYLPLNRKERFYTGSVLPGIICYKNFNYLDKFFKLIPGFDRKIEIKPDPVENNVLFQTEYSFKESLVESYFKEKFAGEYETKDTPDLVILITEPEFILFVGEAKMFSSVTPGDINTQMKNQEWFINALKTGLNIKKENCYHFALLPERLIPGKDSLEYPVIFWEEIIQEFESIMPNDYFLNVLKIAIEKFDDLKSSRSGNATSFGMNMDFKISGAKILELHRSGEKFWVGRFGGLNGEKFRMDLMTNNWENFEYEINSSSISAPNRNWFSSSQFADKVKRHISQNNSDNEAEGFIEKTIPEVLFNSELGDWHFSHLGRDYFLDISRKVGGNGKWDAPIESVYIGKSGVKYIEKKRGRNVNPNWSVILKNGREIKCKTSSGMIENGSWERSHCNVFGWDDIKEFFENQLKLRK